jgi:hypothetical protein
MEISSSMSVPDSRGDLLAPAGDVVPADEPPLGGGDRTSREARSRVRAIGPQIFLSPEQVVQRALRLARIDKADLVAVAGPDGLQAMISLCRAGFDRVECAKQATCAGADEACDLLLIVGPQSPEALADTIRRTGRLLKDGGLLIIQFVDAAAQRVIAPALISAGLRASGAVMDYAAGLLIMHTASRLAATPLRKTA